MRRAKLLLSGMLAVLAMGFSLAISQVVLAEGENVPPGIAAKDETPGKGLHRGWEQGMHKGWNKDVAKDTRDIKQDKKDIAKDNADVKKDIEERQDDTAAIKTDRQALKDAMASGDQAKIKAAREALHKDLRDRAKDTKDMKKDEKEKRQDIRNLNQDKRERREDMRSRK